ncbi:hypothetical protein O181_089008 [Austropuccinia psidii MF-1]|uniref:Helicase associated domain-containing protein n=1 Tax=Austropuccinia psidii MF-1 TaxID=1389203 RepID=A0A9Q3ISH6_9BASI|nr:hypothetical protein [Austropuccinia psidii MF-1]
MRTKPDLAGYTPMIFDESHEHTLSPDIFLRSDITHFRPDLPLLISSATMNTAKFTEYFNDAPIFNIPGRMYPVDILYTPNQEANYMDAAVTTVFQIHTMQPKGDIVGFRTAANQHAGQGGLVAPRRCFQMYTKFAYMKELEETTVPDRQRTNLLSVVLLLKSLGINDLIGIDCLDPPPGYTLVWLLDILYSLGAHNNRGELTKDGQRMAKFPMDPMLSKAIVEMEKHQCTKEVLSIVSM